MARYLSGPYSAQIQRALSAFAAGSPTIVSPTFTGQAKFADGTAAAPSITFVGAPTTGWYRNNAGAMALADGGTARLAIGTNMRMPSDMALMFASTTDPIATADLILVRDDANILAQRNGTNAQTFRIYNTDNGANDEYTRLAWSGNEFIIAPAVTGTGTYRAMQLGTVNTPVLRPTAAAINFYTIPGNVWSMTSSGHFTAGVDNTFDIGASGATRPRTIYAGTSVVAPAYTVGSTAGASFSGVVTNITVVNGIVTAVS
jgi:hypothetical protein